MIKNLTPHAISIVAEDGTIVRTFESDGVARAASKSVPAYMLDGIQVVVMEFGEPVDLPEYQEGTWLIVSLVTANAARAYGRTTSDLLITANPVRDADGRIIGCRNLACV